MIGHLKPKCPKAEYSEDDVKRFERFIKNIGGFQEAIWARDKRLREEVENIRAKELTEVVKLLENKVVPGAAGVPGGTTQLVKTRQSLIWSGWKFDRWKVEVERWYGNNRANDEEKFIDLLESLKKNEVIRFCK